MQLLANILWQEQSFPLVGSRPTQFQRPQDFSLLQRIWQGSYEVSKSLEKLGWFSSWENFFGLLVSRIFFNDVGCR